MICFSTDWPSRFDEDDTVYRHELGNEPVWIAGGGAPEHVPFQRTPERFLAGSIRIANPRGWTEERIRLEKRTQLAERVLAGEIAARAYNSLPLGEICTDTALTVSTNLALLLRGRENDRHDHIKALLLAHAAAGAGWYDWLCERYVAAQALVQLHLETIGIAAEVFAANMPLWEGELQTVQGERVAQQLGFHNATS